MDKLYENSETGCCPRFNPEPWDEKELTFQDKLFIRYTTCPKCVKYYGKNYTVILTEI